MATTSSSTSSTGGAVSGVDTGTTSGSADVSSRAPGGTQHVDVPGIRAAATRYSGYTESLAAVRTRMNELAQEVPTKGGVDATWTQFQTGGYADGTQSLAEAVYSVGQLIQGLHDGLVTAARTLQQGEDDNTKATTRLKDSMASVKTDRLSPSQHEAEQGVVLPEQTAVADGQSGAAGS